MDLLCEKPIAPPRINSIRYNPFTNVDGLRRTKLNPLDYWKLCTDFTIVQAALIICGIAPEELQWRVERTTESDCPEGYIAVRTALRNALASGRIKASSVRFNCYENGEEIPDSFDIELTTISGEEIGRFLNASNVICDFFERFTIKSDGPLDRADLEMPPKLRAAVSAWRAVTGDPQRLRGKSPKQALEQWLIENANELGLLRRDGKPNRTGIEEICKVANWKPEGGATPTPGQARPSPTTPNSTPIRLPPQSPFASDLDDEIPF